ncbi:hypothetical protein B0H15DRAFT_840489 [Mycena belliarum]|uniref:Uncharacterized protein n=1 Tax=Mycena belliarum TaxID=1033014 RepID=A0AAD6U8S2_9AGAR|nr:hypothetical protein B0H15DRAFT_840489 [Mycena belliae]
MCGGRRRPERIAQSLPVGKRCVARRIDFLLAEFSDFSKLCSSSWILPATVVVHVLELNASCFFGAPSRLPPSSHLSPRFYALLALALAQLALAAKGFGLMLPFTTPPHTPPATFAHCLDRRAAPLAPPRRHLSIPPLVLALSSTLMVPMLLFHSCPMLPLAHDPHDLVLRRCTPYRMRRLA